MYREVVYHCVCGADELADVKRRLSSCYENKNLPDTDDVRQNVNAQIDQVQSLLHTLDVLTHK